MISSCPSLSRRSFAGFAPYSHRAVGSHLHTSIAQKSEDHLEKASQKDLAVHCSPPKRLQQPPSAAPWIASCQQSAGPRAQHLYRNCTQARHTSQGQTHRVKNRSGASPHLHCVASSGWGRPRSLLSELRITTSPDWWTLQIVAHWFFEPARWFQSLGTKTRIFFMEWCLPSSGVSLPPVLSASLFALACGSSC